ncbi:MAG: hypothetical protein NW241_17465 [Bacteroidia bacterium]|nr:hypothetical protein [Bacteroidia bacterium]
MKRLSISALLAAAVLLAATSGCTPYPEGPAISFRAALKQISTTWRIKEAIRGGNEVTAEFTDEYLKFEEDGDFSRLEKQFQIVIPPFTQNQTVSAVGSGEWDFVDGGAQLEVLYTFEFQDPYNSAVRYSEQYNERWEILRLAEGQLWIRNGDLTLKCEFFNP